MNKSARSITQDFEKLMTALMASNSIDYDDKVCILEGFKESINFQIMEINAIE